MSQKILVNAIECRFCGHVLRSTHRHDYRTHTCDAMRAHFKDYDPLDKLPPEQRALYRDTPYEPVIMVDGGRDYLRRGFARTADECYIERSTYAP